MPIVYEATRVSLAGLNDIAGTPEADRIAKAALNKLLIFKKPNGKIYVRTVSLVPSRKYAKDHHYDLSNITFKELPKDFNGYQMVMKWNQKQVSTAVIKSGIAQAKVTLERYSKEELQARAKANNWVMQSNNKSLRPEVAKDRTAARGTNPDGSACGGSDFVPNQLWVCAVVPTGDDVADDEHCQEIGHNVDNPDGSGEWVDQPLCEETPPLTDCELYGIGCEEDPDPEDDGCTNCYPQQNNNDSIYNEVTDTCINNMVEEAMNDSLQNEITKFINETFGNTDKIDLFFRQVQNMVDTSTDAHAVTDNPTSDPTYIQARITFNIYALQDASKEYIVATIFHECIHAWIDHQYPTTNMNLNREQHDLMASTSRFNKMRDALMEMFPNLSIQDAEDLTWGGLYKSPAYLLLDTPTRIRIENTNKDYKKSTKGKKC